MPVTQENPVDIMAGVPEATENYRPEVMERWRKQLEDAHLQYVTGELRPMSVDEYAAQRGINLDD